MKTFAVDGAKELDEMLKTNGYSLNWLLSVMHEHNSELMSGGEIERITCESIGDQRGFCSRCYRVNFESTGENSKVLLSLVMKIPTADILVGSFKDMNLDQEILDRLRVKVFRLHDVECDAYSLLADLHSTGFPIPRVFAAEKHETKTSGIVLMEDMSQRGRTITIFDSVTADQCLDFAARIAQFQSFVELMPESSWCGRFRSSLFIHTDERESEEMKKQLRSVADLRPEDQNGVIQKLLALKLRKFAKFAIRERAEDFGASTLCHGDTWSNNLMMSRNADESTGNRISAFLDWSLLFEGSPLFDLARFVVCSADAEVRREVESRVVDVFYTRLKANLNARGPRFTREQATELYELASLHQTVALVEFFRWFGAPLLGSARAEVAKAEKLWLRLKLMLEDANKLMDKYDIVKRFGV